MLVFINRRCDTPENLLTYHWTGTVAHAAHLLAILFELRLFMFIDDSNKQRSYCYIVISYIFATFFDFTSTQ